jgi:hypothetical protein
MSLKRTSSKIKISQDQLDHINWATRNGQLDIIHSCAKLQIFPDQEAINFTATKGDKSVLQALSQYGKFPQTKGAGYTSPRFHYYDETFPKH